MSNLEHFSLNPLVVELPFVKEVLECLLNTIMFHRTLNVVKPCELETIFGVTYPHCGDEQVRADLQTQVQAAVANIEKHHMDKAEVTLSFYERRVKKIWFSKQEEKVCWEQWTINLTISRKPIGLPGSAEYAKTVEVLEEGLADLMVAVLRIVNAKKDHIPPWPPEQIVSPYELTLPGQSDTWSSLIKRVVHASPPLLT
eukprot:TRINITY_DN9039_c0_g1_i2.p1 TRINITY_DN9039_c0_g1~~TRINITY_DN9039_c0_g1_i2.p1  ORF type:complete len:199 (-),score=25.64 TRINITY_DN9039_c0_g1_i2:46-642(-)